MAYLIESVTTGVNTVVMKISWQDRGPALPFKVGISNLNYDGYGYGISFGSTAECNDGGFGSGPTPVSQVIFPSTAGIAFPVANGVTQPVYVRPCFLRAVASPAPQGATYYNTLVPNDSTTSAAATNISYVDAGITIQIQSAGSGGDDDE